MQILEKYDEITSSDWHTLNIYKHTKSFHASARLLIMLKERKNKKKSLLQYEMPREAPKENFTKKEITIEDALNGAITRDVINSILPPIQYEKDGKTVIQYVSIHPAIKADIMKTQTQLEQELKLRGALEIGICPIRSELYAQCFDEIIRQVAIDCTPRGLLLVKLRDEAYNTINTYKQLYESALKWGVRKSDHEENWKDTIAQENDRLRHEIMNLKEGNAKMEQKIESMKQENEESKRIIQSKYKEEVDELKKQLDDLRNQLKLMLVSK